MKKPEHKLLPCVICTIGLNCYVAGHNLVQASIKKLMNNKGKNFVANDGPYIMSKNDDEKTVQ